MLPQPILVSDELTNLEAQEIPHYQSNDKRFFKIIAGIPQLPLIDFSALTEEECKKIGWIDVETFAENELEKQSWDNSINLPFNQGFIKGIIHAQSLNEKKFSEEDLIKCWNESKIDRYSFKHFMEEISQPKVFDVEVEIDLLPNEEGIPNCFEVPKITNNSIKILKVYDIYNI